MSNEYVVEFDIEGKKDTSDFWGGRFTLKGKNAEKVDSLFQEREYGKLYTFLKNTVKKKLRKEVDGNGYVCIRYDRGSGVYKLKDAKKLHVNRLYEVQNVKHLQFNSLQPKEVSSYCECHLIASWTSDFEEALKEERKADRGLAP